jgi:hypothetical protein
MSNTSSDSFTQFGGTCTGVTGKWSGGKSFIAYLDTFLAPCHAAGAEILLMGDFNKTL